MSSVPIVSPSELGSLGRAVLPERPVVGLDLRAAGSVVGTLPRGCILVGIGPIAPGWESLVEGLDLTLVPRSGGRETMTVDEPVAALAVLADTVETAPRAAMVLAGLLRWSVDLSVEDALDAESLAYSTLLGGPEFGAWLARRGARPAPPDVTEPVLVERDGDELRIRLNRAERRNAYGRQMRDALVEALELARWDPSIERVILDGAGPAFCAGGDLDEFGTTPDLVTAHFVRTRAGAGLPLHALRDRVEARLHGACVGAGIELPAFARRVVAAPDTTIRLPEVGMGLIPGAGGTVSIPRRIGRHRTLYLALSGTRLAVGTAKDWGLVDEVTDTVIADRSRC